MTQAASIAGHLSGGSGYKARFVVDTAETFKKGAIVYWDGPSENNIKACAGDGVLMLGIALEDAVDAIASDDGCCIVGVFTPESIVRLAASTQPTVANMMIRTGYGATWVAGVPTLDLTEVTYFLFNIIAIEKVNNTVTGYVLCLPVGSALQLFKVVS